LPLRLVRRAVDALTVDLVGNAVPAQCDRRDAGTSRARPNAEPRAEQSDNRERCDRRRRHSQSPGYPAVSAVALSRIGHLGGRWRGRNIRYRSLAGLGWLVAAEGSREVPPHHSWRLPQRVGTVEADWPAPRRRSDGAPVPALRQQDLLLPDPITPRIASATYSAECGLGAHDPPPTRPPAASDWWNSVAVTAGYTTDTTMPSGASSRLATCESKLSAAFVAE